GRRGGALGDAGQERAQGAPDPLKPAVRIGWSGDGPGAVRPPDHEPTWPPGPDSIQQLLAVRAADHDGRMVRLDGGTGQVVGLGSQLDLQPGRLGFGPERSGRRVEGKWGEQPFRVLETVGLSRRIQADVPTGTDS